MGLYLSYLNNFYQLFQSLSKMKPIHQEIDELVNSITNIVVKIVEKNDDYETEIILLLTNFKEDLSSILYKSQARDNERNVEEDELNTIEVLDLKKYDDFYDIEEDVECQVEDKSTVIAFTAKEEIIGKIEEKPPLILQKLEQKAGGFRRKKRMFKCPSGWCDARFYTDSNLAEHAPVCQGNKAVHCPFCEEKFKAASYLIVGHVETNHAMERNNPLFSEFVAKHPKTWICQECGKVFINKTVFNKEPQVRSPAFFS